MKLNNTKCNKSKGKSKTKAKKAFILLDEDYIGVKHFKNIRDR